MAPQCKKSSSLLYNVRCKNNSGWVYKKNFKGNTDKCVKRLPPKWKLIK